MAVDLTPGEIDTLLESIKYSTRAIRAASGTPTTVRQENLDQLDDVEVKLRNELSRKGNRVKQFLTKEDDQSFKEWMAQHPHGYYLNERNVGNMKRGKGGVLLHRVGCHHLGTGEGMISTTYAKAASDDAKELIEWAKREGLTFDACSSCKPD